MPLAKETKKRQHNEEETVQMDAYKIMGDFHKWLLGL